MRKNIAVFISGNGSNLQALIDKSQDHQAHYQVSLVLSDQADAYGIKRAENHNIPCFIRTDIGREADFYQLCLDHDIDMIVLAGYMRMITPYFLGKWQQPIINIHPSLLPKYKGLDTHQRVLANHEANHGCTVHHVTDGMDEGEIIDQMALIIHNHDTMETLKKRVHKLEHHLYPICVNRLCSP